MGRKKITQSDMDAIARIKNKAVHNQWYETAQAFRNLERELLQKEEEGKNDDILDVIKKESFKRVCPRGHKYTANEFADFCPKCVNDKIKQNENKNSQG